MTNPETRDDEAELPAQLMMPKLDPMIQTRAVKMRDEALSVIVSDEPSSLNAQEGRAMMQTRIKILTEQRMSATRPLDSVKQIIMGWFKPAIDNLTEGRDHLDEQIISYQKRVREAAAEAQRKADEAAEKERKRLEVAAQKATARGDADKAQTFLDRADAVVAPIISADPAKAAGVSVVKRWTWDLIDVTKLQHPYLMADTAKISKQVTALGKDAQQLLGPGVRVYQAESLATRSTATKKGW